jgi:hypothetical protein
MVVFMSEGLRGTGRKAGEAGRERLGLERGRMGWGDRGVGEEDGAETGEREWLRRERMDEAREREWTDRERVSLTI